MNRLLIIAFALVLCVQSRATTRYAAALTPAAVQTEVNASSDNDTIILPAGTSAAWTTSVSITGKALTITGAGIGQTIINDSGGAGSFTCMFNFATMADKRFEISGITFVADPTLGSYATIIATNSHNFKIHDIEFTDMKRRGFYTASQTGTPSKGVIYNCLFEAPFNISALAVHAGGTDFQTPPAFNASGAGAAPVTFGNDDAIYVENCTFDFTYANDSGLEIYNGGNAVVRYSTLTNAGIGIHGNDSSVRSGFKIEVYENTITNTLGSGGPQFQYRGGVGVFFNNTTSDNTGGAFAYRLILDNYRATGNLIYPAAVPPFFADGSAPTDGNSAANATATGTHNGGTGQTNLTDTTKSWTTDEWLRGGNPATFNKPYYVWNRTSGAGAWATANTSTVVTTALTGGSRQTWSDGDTYVITCGYPSLDQVGWAGATTFASYNSDQVKYGMYQWNNSSNGTPNTGFPFTVGHTGGVYAGVWPDGAVFIREGREFFSNTVKPGYTPYTYPHPLRAIQPAPTLQASVAGAGF